MPLKLSAKRPSNKSLSASSPASIVAIVAAPLPSVGGVIAASACESRSCDSNVGVAEDACENGVACKASAIALRGEGQQGSRGVASTSIGWFAVPRANPLARLLTVALLELVSLRSRFAQGGIAIDLIAIEIA
jgi:hypothetical protein